MKQPKNKGGRPAFKVTERDRQMVEVLTGLGVTQERVASLLGIHRQTVWRLFKPELSRGHASVEAKLVSNLFKMALGNDATALRAIMFILQARFGWEQTPGQATVDVTILNKPMWTPGPLVEMSVEQWVAEYSPKEITNGHGNGHG